MAKPPVLRLSRRRFIALAALGVACSPRGAAPTATPGSALAPPRAAPGQLTGVLPATDLAVGTNNRFLLGLLDDRNRPVSDAQVELRFFKVLDQASAQLRGSAQAQFRGSPQLGDKGLYVARASFDEAGPWGVEVQAARPGGESQTLRLGFEVRAQSQTPAIGSPAPASQTVTASSPAEAEKICSARPVDDFHRLSIADALAQRKPLLVLFGTPGFCVTRTCGPSLEVVQTVAAQHGERLNVVHVEIYKGAQPPEVVPAVGEWRLPSEPWVFLVGGDGKIVDKLEGGITVDELAPAAAKLISDFRS